MPEYLALVKASKQLADSVKNEDEKIVPIEMRWLIRFMVNSFIRPVDIKLIQHKHIEVITGSSAYLRLNLPETKGYTGQVVTMQAAKGVYQSPKQYQESRGYGKSIDLLTLARNARTSVEMIERIYSSNLTAEMNIEMLQSKRIKSY